MSKLSTDEKFIDLSDYGRPIAIAFAKCLVDTRATPIQVTFIFGICGLIAVYCIIAGFYITAGIFLILKSIIDAMDGELARLKNTPSYTGRYLDSIFDIILNFFFLMAIWFVSDSSLWMTLIAFVCLQLQGTLYNYYYVILRHNTLGGERTSKVFEKEIPKAFPEEDQLTVDKLFMVYRFLYSYYDKTIYMLDKKAQHVKPFPKWFMSLISVYGLGFQLLIISTMLAVGWIAFIVPFFVGYTGFIFIFISIRKKFLSEQSIISYD
jgi:CDP-diacylglycerol---serine O-phosphatidyltransferase